MSILYCAIESNCAEGKDTVDAISLTETAAESKQIWQIDAAIRSLGG
jgi:hypothetical protein